MTHVVQNRYRQAVTVIAALLLAFSVFGAVGIVTAQEVMVTQSPTSTTAVPGETVTISSTISVEELNGPGLEVMLPAGWQGTITDADGGETKPPEGSANVLQIVWLQSGEYEVTCEIEVPDDAAPGEYTVDVEGSGINPDDESRVVESVQTTITVEEPDKNQGSSAGAGSDQSVNDDGSSTRSTASTETVQSTATPNGTTTTGSSADPTERSSSVTSPPTGESLPASSEEDLGSSLLPTSLLNVTLVAGIVLVTGLLASRRIR